MVPHDDPVPGFDLDAPPFDLLDPASRQRVAASVDLGYYPAGTVLIEAGHASDHVFVPLKGRVLAFDRDGEETLRFDEYGPGELFGAFAVLAGRARHSYRAEDDALCFQIPAPVFRRLLDDSPRFAAWFHEGLAIKRQVRGSTRQPSELNRLMLTRVRDAQLAPAVRVEANTAIAAACERLRAERVDCLLVEPAEGQNGPGIVTRTDLLEALALHGLAPGASIAPLASRPLVAVRADDMLFQALVTMTERHIERVAVRDDQAILGTLGMAEVLAHYANTSHLISLRLARAGNLTEIAEAARGTTNLVRTLHAQGARIGYLMEMVSALNGRILSRVFESVVPERHRNAVCLLVLGSEGRREQILKTDQDNALVLAEDLDWPEAGPDGLAAAMDRFAAALADIGYPPCPGRVMVSNPRWRLSVAHWRERVEAWRREPTPEAMLELSIALDARPVAGNERLFEPVAEAMHALGRDDILIRQMAEPLTRFAPALTLFGRIRDAGAGTDVKKGGIFPLVHGLRVLALKHGVVRRNSFDRCRALVQAGALSAEMADNVRQALAVLQRLRLSRQLDEVAAGRPADDRVPAAALTRLDRELLRDALREVKGFIAHLGEALHLRG